MKQEFSDVETQIAELHPTLITRADEKQLSIKHILVCSATLIRICDAKYEFLLNNSYKLVLRQWQARSKEAKGSKNVRKNTITNKFYEEMGLVVDQLKQEGGNGYDGNSSRKFFDNPVKAAEITGLDYRIIIRFSTILSTLSSCHYIKIENFKRYCLDTAYLLTELYGWYHMSASVHKLLIHGGDIIKSLPLPVGQLSEDVLEVSHKDYKWTDNEDFAAMSNFMSNVNTPGSSRE
ncbi:hypothetical protein ILUMI_18395 [Ignelater luminosus]|uniref:Uncharacterized protein n=1 Tax=Ignelater luminosus TaxID=2038154 RepID=A0A8K0CNN8_IGNLU|nr:hypothetical protein ILUMI_18395 [Ignelater luminosus]